MFYFDQSDKINLDIQRVVGYRQWCNKLWNAIRFAMSKLGDDYTAPSNVEVESLPFICKWILSLLNQAISRTVLSLETYEFSDAATAAYAWWQFKMCDVFIEAIKPYFSSDKDEYFRRSARDVLWICLDNGLRLLHPFMPFVTEELWQRLPQPAGISTKKDSIMISHYPSVVRVRISLYAQESCKIFPFNVIVVPFGSYVLYFQEWTNEQVEHEMDLVESAVKSIRSLRSSLPANQRNERYTSQALEYNL